MNKLLDKNGIEIFEDNFGKIFMKPKNPISVVLLANDNGHFILINQYRNPIDSYSVQLPGGGVESNETLEQAARREFKEETGYACDEVLYLGSMVPASWRSNEITHVFYSKDITRCTEQELESHEQIKVVRLGVRECLIGVKENKLNDSELCYAILQAILKGFVAL
jgi:ADP-ribose pyrophosphatase